MKSLAIQIVFLLLFLCASNVLRAIELEDVKDSKGNLVFRVMLDHYIEIPNLRRNNKSNPFLKFAIHGANIDTIEKTNDTSVWNLKLSDKTSAQFSKRQTNEQVDEYYFHWNGGGPNDDREVCFYYGFKGAKWYQTYKSNHSTWPMDTSRRVSSVDINYILDDVWETHNDEFMFVVEHLFINTDGFAILLDPNQPLFMRRDPNRGEPLLCFAVKNSKPYMTNITDQSYLDLKFHIFAASNIRTVTDHVIDQSNLIPKPTTIPDEILFSYSIWNQWSQGNVSQNAVLTYSREFERHGFTNVEIQIGSQWRKWDLEMEVDVGFFPDFDSLMFDLHKRGFRVQSILSNTATNNFKQLVEYFLVDNLGHKTDQVDFSNPQAREWYLAIVKRHFLDYKIDSCYVEFAPPAKNVNLYQIKDAEIRKCPNLYVKKYVETMALAGSSISSAFAFKMQHLQIFVRLLNLFPNVKKDKILKVYLSNILSISTAGYSFVEPYPALFGYENEELYIRWVQAMSLMPRMVFFQSPWQYSENCVKLTKKFVDLHAQHFATLIDLAKKRVQTGSPIIRPLWYVAPDDPQTYTIDDQFMVGNDILVAPVLVEGQRERSLYLPPGEWLDQRGESHSGSKVIKVAVPLDELAYFKRKI